jgi:phosphatidylserine decarboxylase
MTLHREGRTLLITSLIIVLGINAFFAYLFPDREYLREFIVVITSLFYLIILQFFRVPKRHTEINPQHIIAPADGKVVVIEETVESEYFKGTRRQISIFMSPLNVHINFNPISGIVSYFKYHPGKFLVAWHPKSSTENERSTMVIETSSKKRVLVRQIAGALARRICFYASPGQSYEKGDEFGFIKFGSRVDVFLPLDAQINVSLEQKVKNREDILATL